jgi:magnesium-transporting ATPase (P-type)
VDLEIDESNLTGETNPRRKHCEPITANSFAELALSERDNIGFMATLVRNGELIYLYTAGMWWWLDIYLLFID